MNVTDLGHPWETGVRILLVKLLLPFVTVVTFYEPFFGVLFFILIAFVRPEVLTWNMIDARFALLTSVITLASWLMHMKSPRQRADRIPVQFWIYIFIMLMMSLSSIYAEASVDDSWFAVQKLWKYALFQFLMIQMINNERRLRWVQETLFWGVNFLVLWGFDQYFRGNYRLERVGGGDFADSSGLAALFNLMFPMVLYRLYHPNRWVRVTGMIFTPLYLIDLTFTESRSGFLGASAALLIIFARAKHKLRYVLAAIPLVLLLNSVMPGGFMARMSTIRYDETEEQPREASADARVKVWAVAWAVFKDHPVLGVGRANFGLIHQDYAYRIWHGLISDYQFEDLFLRFRVCHNMFLDLLVSNGLATFIPWCLLVISVPLTLARARKRLGTSSMDQYWRFQTYALEIGILGFMITGIFQDLAEVEVFYWAITLAGIMATVIERRAWEAGQYDDEPVEEAPSMPVSGMVVPRRTGAAAASATAPGSTTA